MSARWYWLSIAMLGLSVAETRAQTIQLPVFHTFATSTTVVVPDNGGAFLGGDSSGAFGASQFGGIGSMTMGGGIGAIAQIHDLPAMDAQLLAGANAAAAGPPDLWTAKLAAARSNMTAAPGQSIAEIRQQLKQQDTLEQAQWQASFEQGKRALADGKPGIAKIYFQSVAKHATGALQERAQAELQSLAAKPAVMKQR